MKQEKQTSNVNLNATNKNDISDSPKDAAKLQPDNATIDMPDVEDIPGQENFKVMPMEGIADTTIASYDEEGSNLFDEDKTTNNFESDDTDVTQVEKDLLSDTSENMPTADDEGFKAAALDSTDNDGDAINEDGDIDTSGTDEDDADEEIGEEDEENNTYSLGGDNHEEETAETS